MNPAPAIVPVAPRLLRWQDVVAFVGPLGAVGVHEHRAAALLLGLDGPFRIRRADGRWLACEGALLAAGLPHELDCGERSLAVVYFDPLVHGPLLAPGSIVPAPANAAWLRRGREAVLQLLADPVADGKRLRELLLEDLLPRAGHAASGLRDGRLRELQAMLDDAAASSLSLPQLARRLGLSDSRFSHLFSGRTGVSWTAYRNWTRLLDSCGAMAQTPEVLTRIALDRGYSSPAHFAASFRAGFGITPTQLRRMQPRFDRLAADF
ncbi:MAG TPA: AraC family transcriptional regulator [Solimonas sp.]|nr:AraC family transcriptional regulator [Solimonas sp.]